MELPKQVCEPLQCDARENVCTSSDQSSPERNDLVASRAEDDDSMVQSGSGVLLFPAPRPPSEQAQVPQPEPGLKCPRCDSTNTKFCYFNNHSLTRPRHFCHTCGRYWLRGGALRRVRVGSGFSCHAKRSTKSKASAREPAAAAGTASSALTATTPNTTSCTGTAPPGFNQYSMFCTKSASPHSNWFADNFDPASPGFGSPARLLFPQQVLKGVDIGLQSGSGGDCEDGASSTTE